MTFPYRIASDRGSSFFALAADGSEQIVHVHPADPRPAVGDFVTVDDDARVRAIAPRRGVLARARGDRGHTAQVVAVGIDVLFIVTAPGRDFSPSRVERYLVAACSGGIAPVVVLNKRELADDIATLVANLYAVSGDAPVVDISATTGAGCDALTAQIGANTTVALVGSSGVGKSTLANRLLGDERFATGDIGSANARGRHTTTRRELVALPGGGWLIDTPGMRAFAPWADDDALTVSFDDIAEAAQRCRFRDCSHDVEPGCAVVAEIDPGRLARWRALLAELAYLERRNDPAQLANEKRRWKAIHKANRARDRAGGL